jgi:hypothetical protein
VPNTQKKAAAEITAAGIKGSILDMGISAQKNQTGGTPWNM